jgi:tocopherol O-methyltransferase
METGAGQHGIGKRQCLDPLAYLRRSAITTYKKAEAIYSQDEEAVSIYVVISGKVKVLRLTEHGPPSVVDIYTSDDLFGEGALVQSRRAESAVTLEKTVVMSWTASEIQVRVLENPKLALAMIQMAAMRSVEIGYRLESFCFDGNSCRLARALIRFSDRFGKMTRQGESRMLALSHKLLAQYIGTWRESVTQHNVCCQTRNCLNGGETPERAQIQLMEQLARRAAIPRGAKVLDIGCGVGGSALWLAEQYECRVTGMTISPVQAGMATRKAKSSGLNGKVLFEVRDANRWRPEPASSDAIWIMESSEHFPDKKHFFERCALALKPEGTLAVCAWLRRDGAMPPGEQPLVATIAEAMMSASLDSLSSYREWMCEAGLTVTAAEDIARHVEHTWVHCDRIAANPVLKFLVRFTGGQ